MAKINPNFSNFFAKATAAGYGTNQIMSFLQDVFSNPSATAEKNRLGKGISEGTLRPDEEAAAHAIHRAEAPERALKKAGTLATSVGGVGLGVTKLPGLIKQGVALASQMMGKGGQAAPAQENAGSSQEAPSTPADQFLRSHPELGNYLDGLISQGMSPIEAAQKAKSNPRWGATIDKIEGDIGQDFISLIAQIFGIDLNQRSGGQANQTSPQGSNQSGGDSELIAALQQILKM
jgi:hypothetical protein